MTTNGQHSTDSGSPSRVVGLVEAVNERGIRINGDWFSVSKFRPVSLPDVGARVRLKVDPKGFITTLEVLDGDTVATPVASARERTISRLSVLKSAAAFAASRPDIKSADVVAIAERWLAWVES